MSASTSPSLTTEYLSEDIGPTILATASLMIILITLFVGLRYYARCLTNTNLSVEDFIIPFAWCAEVGLCVTGIVMVLKAGTGRHMDYITLTDPGRIPEHFKGIIIIEILHLPAVAFPKLCVVLLYLRIFVNKWERRITWILLCIISTTWVSYTIAIMFQCVPFAYNWDKTIPKGRCFNFAIFSHSSSVPNIATDVVVLILPIRTVLHLKVSTARKIGLLLIFLTGSVGIIASIIRTVVFARTDPLVDVTFTHADLVNWSIIEPGMYLIAACALSFKPLFRMFAKAFHLHSFLTHFHSTTGEQTPKSKGRSRSVSRSRTGVMGMETLKTEQNGGFAKLGTGKDDQVNTGERNHEDSGLKVVVTTTLEMNVESRSVYEGTHSKEIACNREIG